MGVGSCLRLVGVPAGSNGLPTSKCTMRRAKFGSWFRAKTSRSTEVLDVVTKGPVARNKDVRHKRLTSARISAGQGQPAQITSVDKAIDVRSRTIRPFGQQRCVDWSGLSAQTTNERLFALSPIAQSLRRVGQRSTYVTGTGGEPERADDPGRLPIKPEQRWCDAVAGAGASDANALLADLKAGKLKGGWIWRSAAREQALADTNAIVDGLELFICRAVSGLTAAATGLVQLPAAAWAEVDGTFTNSQNLVQRLQSGCTHKGDARSHLRADFSRIAKKANRRGEKWQVSARQAFLQMVVRGFVIAACRRGSGSECGGRFASVGMGQRIPPVQLRLRQLAWLRGDAMTGRSLSFLAEHTAVAALLQADCVCPGAFDARLR